MENEIQSHLDMGRQRWKYRRRMVVAVNAICFLLLLLALALDRHEIYAPLVSLLGAVDLGYLGFATYQQTRPAERMINEHSGT